MFLFLWAGGFWVGVVVAVATATVCSPLLLVSSATISQGFLETPRPEMDWTMRNAIIITNEYACMFAHIYVYLHTLRFNRSRTALEKFG